MKIKRIIEIENTVFTEFKNGIKSMQNDCIISNAVFDSKPYDDSGDLICREALKKEISSYEREFAPDWVLNCIDNAPTVEYTFEEAFQKTVCEQRLYCPERTQGEWIFDGWGTYCSECGYRPKIGCGKFCSECGAKMKGDTK